MQLAPTICVVPASQIELKMQSRSLNQPSMVEKFLLDSTQEKQKSDNLSSSLASARKPFNPPQQQVRVRKIEMEVEMEKVVWALSSEALAERQWRKQGRRLERSTKKIEEQQRRLKSVMEDSRRARADFMKGDLKAVREDLTMKDGFGTVKDFGVIREESQIIREENHMMRTDLLLLGARIEEVRKGMKVLKMGVEGVTKGVKDIQVGLEGVTRRLESVEMENRKLNEYLRRLHAESENRDIAQLAKLFEGFEV